MAETTKPDKQAVRDYMRQRTRAKQPPPTPEQVRRELGWELVPTNKPRGK